MPAAWKSGKTKSSDMDDFRLLVVKRRDACLKFKDDKPSKDRREALQFYRGDDLDVYGDSGDGLSTVVSRDTMEAVESVMPPLVRPFVAGEEVVAFDPIEQGDLESTAQATDYVNHVFRRHNSVLDVIQTSLKDGLLFRLGVAKTVVEECEDGAPEAFEGLTEEEYVGKRVELHQQGRDVAEPVPQDPETGLYTITVPPRKTKRFRVHIIAPDEFLYEERLASLDQASFLGHSKQIPLGDLIDMGIDEKKAKALGSGRPDDQERDQRFEREQEEDWADDDLARPVWVDECYIRCDYDKNGVLAWRKVLLGGNQSTLLSNEPVDRHPYSVWTPIPIPHKLVGMSFHDMTRDIQMNKTAIQRESNNALYLANRPMREVVDGQVNMEDLLNPSVGGIVRVKAGGAIQALPSGGEVAFSASAQMIEYWDSVREARTGVTRYNQGMDANSLNKTATGMNIIASASQQRQELVARQFGEFLADIFDRLLELVTEHADPADVERLRGKPFVPWPTDHDTNVSIGLGTNNKDQVVSHLMALAQMFERVIQLQQGIEGPLVTADNVYEVLKRLPEAMGLKGNFFTDPAKAEQMKQQQPPQPPQPDPTKVVTEQMRGQTAENVAHIRGQYQLAAKEPNVVPIPVPTDPNVVDPSMAAM